MHIITPAYVEPLVSSGAREPLPDTERVVQTKYRGWGAPTIVGLHGCAGAGTVIVRPRDISDTSRYRVYLEGCSAIEVALLVSGAVIRGDCSA